jgi:hypothetical protein
LHPKGLSLLLEKTSFKPPYIDETEYNKKNGGVKKKDCPVLKIRMERPVFAKSIAKQDSGT